MFSFIFFLTSSCCSCTAWQWYSQLASITSVRSIPLCAGAECPPAPGVSQEEGCVLWFLVLSLHLLEPHETTGQSQPKICWCWVENDYKQQKSDLQIQLGASFQKEGMTFQMGTTGGRSIKVGNVAKVTSCMLSSHLRIITHQLIKENDIWHCQCSEVSHIRPQKVNETHIHFN